MDIEAKLTERHRLLEKMRDALRDAMLECELIEPEDVLGEGAADSSVPTTLRITLNGIGKEGAIGDFFFAPIISEEAVVQNFTAIVNLSEDVNEEHLPQLFEAMSYVNSHVPGGAFYVSEAKSFLSFKITLPLPMELGGDALLTQMNIIAGNTITIANIYAGILSEVNAGEKTAADVAAAMEAMAG